MPIKTIFTLFLAIIFLPIASAHAHIVNENSGFMAGLTHPALGLDHFLAMLSVGIISAQIGGRAIWTVPATFVSMMAVGGILGFNQIHLPSTEYILSFSVFALGLTIAFAKKMPVLLAMVFVGIFGTFHGYAHGLEMPATAKAFPYASGFLIATASIHITGVLIGVIAKKHPEGYKILRYSGAIIAGMGLEMILVMESLCS